MTSREFRFALSAIAKRFTMLFMGVIVLFNLFQTAALADSISLRTESDSNVLVALAASSRFAAKTEIENQESELSETKLDELREKRREWQSEVSAAANAANTEAEDTAESPAGRVFKNKLNLDEITEENEIVEEIKNH